MTKKEGVCMMNGVSMNSQVNFQGKGKLSNKQCEKILNGLKKSITEEQKATQKSINTVGDIFNKFQKGEITEKETVENLTKILEQLEGIAKGLNVIG